MFDKIHIQVTSSNENDGYLETPEQSLQNMISTALGERLERPNYGSEFYKLVDKELNNVWILQAKKTILECTRNSVNGELWDERVDIKKLNIKIIEAKAYIEVTLK